MNVNLRVLAATAAGCLALSSCLPAPREDPFDPDLYVPFMVSMTGTEAGVELVVPLCPGDVRVSYGVFRNQDGAFLLHGGQEEQQQMTLVHLLVEPDSIAAGQLTQELSVSKRTLTDDYSRDDGFTDLRLMLASSRAYSTLDLDGGTLPPVGETWRIDDGLTVDPDSWHEGPPLSEDDLRAFCALVPADER